MKLKIMILLIFICLSAQQINIDNLNQLKGEKQTATIEPATILVNRTSAIDDTIVSLEITLSMIPGVYVYSTEDNFFELETQGINIGSPEIILPPSKQITNFDGKTVDIFSNGQKILITAQLHEKKWSLKGYLRYQACDSLQCFLPKTVDFFFSSNGNSTLIAKSQLDTVMADTTLEAMLSLLNKFQIVGKAGGYLTAEKFIAFLDNPSSSKKDMLAGKSLWIVVILTIIGGIALNLTPCVLPMIPITLAIIGAGAHAKSRMHGFLIGGVYGLAMAFSYGILGLIVVLTGTQFGTINSSPVFNIIIATVFILLALAMFDIIHIDFTKYRSGIKHNKDTKGHFVPVFIMGIVTALLAGACVAPVVISVVLYAAEQYSQGKIAGLFLPFLLGTGMALPWPVAGAGITFLPKPGQWMVWVRNIFGIFILVIALYYGYTGIKLYVETQNAPKKSLSISESNSKLNWHYSFSEALDKSIQNKKPVLIDFWATWCKNCTAMDKTTFQNEMVVEKLNSYILVKYQAEQPGKSETKKVLDYFNIVGLPSYVILIPK